MDRRRVETHGGGRAGEVENVAWGLRYDRPVNGHRHGPSTTTVWQRSRRRLRSALVRTPRQQEVLELLGVPQRAFRS